MSSGQINLISEKRQGSFKEQQRIKILKFFALGCLGFVAFISVITFLLTTAVPLNKIKKEQENTNVSLSSLQGKSAKLYTVNERILHISKILKNRRDYSLLIDSVLKNVPTEVSINSVDIDDKDLLITVNSFSLKQINQFLNNFSDLSEDGKIFSKVTIKNLSSNRSNGTYTISLKATLI